MTYDEEVEAIHKARNAIESAQREHRLGNRKLVRFDIAQVQAYLAHLQYLLSESET